MRTPFILGCLLLALAGCASKVYPTLNTDYANEQWRSQIETDTTPWVQHADAWFLKGDDRPPAGTVMKVQVPAFTTIKTNGSYQVQIVGTRDHAHFVNVYGANAEVRRISVSVHRGVLCIEQVDAPKQPKADLHGVIVRIGVSELHHLAYEGSGSVEGIWMKSPHLMIDASGSGDIILAGDMNVQRIFSKGSGDVTVLGANTPVLDVTQCSGGSVNISGNVGIRDVHHEGSGDFNVIGANSDGVNVFASGEGKLGFLGNFDVKTVEARGHTCVLMMTSKSLCTEVGVFDQAKVGMAGWVDNLSVDVQGESRFLGRDLQADTVYVRATDDAHVNVTGRTRVFASARDHASIYFYGDPAVLTPFTSGYGVVLPMWEVSSAYKDHAMIAPLHTGVAPRVYQPKAKYRWKNGHLEMVQAG